MGRPNLSAADRHLLDRFRTTVMRDFGHVVRDITVFGSKARGEATDESDLDILVLIEAGDWRLKDQIADIAYELAIGTDVVPSVVVYTVAEWDYLDHIGSIFRAAVTRDGVAA